MTVTANSIITPQGLASSAVTFVNADGTTAKSLYTAGANGSIVVSISACSSDTSAVNMQVFANNGSTNYLIGTVNIPASSGANGTANSVALLNTTAMPHAKLDSSGNPTIQLPSGWSLQVAPLANVTSAKTVYVVCSAETL
jgi:hypothetical protein